jgi:hypothetical protein
MNGPRRTSARLDRQLLGRRAALNLASNVLIESNSEKQDD